MLLSNSKRVRQQVRFLQRQFLQEGGLPFTNILSIELISQALTAAEVTWNDRIYPPLVTLWVFLSQVLSADQSCGAAVARLIAHRLAHGQSECSARTGGYCRARRRLPEKFFSAVACHVGRVLDSQVNSKWLWKGRRVYMFDGTTVTMADTAANQKTYPQIPTQRAGMGSPIARVGAIISLSCGAIVGLGACRYAGKGQGEVSLLRKLWDILSPGDVLLGDRLMANWTNIAMLQQRGLDLVSRLNKANRKADFRKGERLGKGDHIVRWKKPATIRSVDRETYQSLPDFVTVRETRIRVQTRAFRTKSIIVVTTFLDPKQTTKEDLAFIYRQRWSNELDLRSIKSTMQMHDLRCKTPELVRKEIWMHVLAYNLIRTIMAQAATKHEIEPRTISFKGAIQTLAAFQPVIEFKGARNSEFREELYEQLLKCIASHRVANRQDRFEPRKIKRRYRYYDFLNKPRCEAKLDILKGVKEK